MNSTSSNNNKNHNNNNKPDNEKAFVKKYAQEIAKALLDREDTPIQMSVEDSLPILYRTLCFDEPILDETAIPNLPVVAAALARKLTAPASNSNYAISNRLVNGIVYMCQQQSHNRKSSIKENQNGQEDSTATSQPNGANSENMSIAMAKLAFAALVQVPIECCQRIDTISQVRRYLGSYKGAPIQTNTKEPSPVVDGTTADIETERQITQLTGSPVLDENDLNEAKYEPADDSSLQEVWAAESDPSDYDYDEGIPVLSQDALFSAIHEDILDPVVLSRADDALTKEQAQDAIVSLLRQVNFTLLSPLFALSKKDVSGYISELTQLLLLLLQPQPGKQQQTTILNHVEESHVNLDDATVQDATLAPLWILRDVALHPGAPSSLQSFHQSSYLEVLQTLLAIDQAYQKDSASTTTLCMASIVGLSALSSWCSNSNVSVSLTTTAILDSMNDLSHVIERASESGYKDHLRYSLIPILELLTGITYTTTRKTTISPPSSVAQALLNTGLLRHALMLSLEEEEEKGDHKAPQQHHYLDHALWGLCVVYPTLIGKYVSRFPRSPVLVRRYNLQQLQPMSDEQKEDISTVSRDCVSSILWHCHGYIQCTDSASSAPQVVWKSAKNAKQDTAMASPLTKDECKEVCEKAWVRLCTTVDMALTECKANSTKSLEVLKDWERLLVFIGTPFVAATFRELVADAHDAQLLAIRTTLSNNCVDSATNTKDVTEEKVDDPAPTDRSDKEEDPEDVKKPAKSNRQLVAATARKVLKQYVLFFQGNSRSSSKTD